MKLSSRTSIESERLVGQDGSVCSENVEAQPSDDRFEVEFSDADYTQVAECVAEAIDGRDFLSATLTTFHPNFEAELILTLIIYRNFDEEVEEVVPVWWEMHTYDLDTGDEHFNDFSFATLREVLISK